MAKTAAGRLLLCGTNAFKPICKEYNILNRNYTVEKEKPGQAVCPYDPHHNSTAIYVGEYIAKSILFMGCFDLVENILYA